jgi:hypothetical protein
MLYYNGWQTLNLDHSVVKAIEGYDKCLFIWQDPIDEHFKISHNKYEKRDRHSAVEGLVMSIKNEDGTVRKPRESDVYELVKRDMKHTTVEELIKRCDNPMKEKRRREKEQIELITKTALQDLKFARSRRPTKY